MKIKAAADVGITARHVNLPPSTTQDELLKVIDELNNSPGSKPCIVFSLYSSRIVFMQCFVAGIKFAVVVTTATALC